MPALYFSPGRQLEDQPCTTLAALLHSLALASVQVLRGLDSSRTTRLLTMMGPKTFFWPFAR
eukprot:423414-Amphidinium_carterae.1